MRQALLTTALLATGALALGACGSDSSSSADKKPGAGAGAAKVALREVGETRDALAAALASYKGGDKKAAEEQVSEAYVQHFEEVEHPLEAKDAELKEKLEKAIATQLRDAMKAGKPAAEVEQAVQAVSADLDKAEAALR